MDKSDLAQHADPHRSVFTGSQDKCPLGAFGNAHRVAIRGSRSLKTQLSPK